MNILSPRKKGNGTPCKDILSIDVEDWFHILDSPAAPKIERCASLESQVERKIDRILQLLHDHAVRATFFWLGDEYDKRYGLDDKYLARISEINYRNAKNNSNAQTRDWFMSFEHTNTIGAYNIIVSGRIKITDCSQVTDGAVALYLASEKFTNNYAKRKGLNINDIPQILGWGHTTAPIDFTKKITYSAGEEYVMPFTRKAITDAFKRAGVADCWELDCIETHDCFTTTEYMTIDHFGLTKPGESWQAIEDGIIELGGRLPMNPSGGLIGCGHPVGATGVRQLLDTYKQVTLTAGDYQVPDAKKVATLNIGGTATTNVCFILGK